MQLIWVDDSFPQKDKNNNYHLDSSRTADSFLYNPEEMANREEEENLNISSMKYNANAKTEETNNLINDLKVKNIKSNYNIISFKKRLSLVLCIIYSILFLISIPKIAVKIGKEQNIDTLIKNNLNMKLNILINNFNFHKDGNNNSETSGYLLKFEINKIYVFRWILGFSYFIIKCICFIYSNNDDNNTNYLLDKKGINLIQKISMLFFPLTLFYYDLKNNISYSEIKVENINNQIITFYAMTIKRFSLVDYIEGLIPTFFYFLLSVDYNNLEKVINNFYHKKKKEK